MKSLIARIIVCFCLSLAGKVYAEVQNDFDGDGVSDLTFTSSGGTTLLWKATGSHAHDEQLNKSFGISTDLLSLAHWLGAGTPVLGLARLDSDGKKINWKILKGGLIAQAVFGKAGDIAIAGGDYDGDGAADAAVVRIVKGRLHWQVWEGMFLANPGKVKSFNLGTNGDRAFFLNLNGVSDSVAVFGPSGKSKSRLLVKDLTDGKTRSVKRFPASLSRGERPRPFPIRQSDNTDLIGFVKTDQTDTTVLVYNTSAQKIADVTFPGLGTVFVGDYLPNEAGEEIAFQSGTSITFFNPVTSGQGTQSAVSGTPLDEISVGPAA